MIGPDAVRSSLDPATTHMYEHLLTWQLLATLTSAGMGDIVYTTWCESVQLMRAHSACLQIAQAQIHQPFCQQDHTIKLLMHLSM